MLAFFSLACTTCRARCRKWLANGFVTFGCFNNVAKITPATIGAWATILDRLYHDREHRNRVAEACWTNALRPEYDWDSIGQQWDALLRNI